MTPHGRRIAAGKNTGKPQKDLRDVFFIMDNLERFSAMTFDEIKKHLEDHPEDKLHSLKMNMGGHCLISRDAARCFSQLASRQREIDSDKHSISNAALDNAIRKAFVDVFIDKGKPIERKWIDRMLNQAIRLTKKNHEQVAHYLPCVVTTKGEPVEFHIGPVRFITADKFFADYRTNIEADYKTSNERRKAKLDMMLREDIITTEREMSEEDSARLDQKILSRIFEYYEKYLWIAEVSIPKCNAAVSRDRAEIAIQASLDILKLFFHPIWGTSLRLAHNPGPPDRTADLVCDRETGFSWSIRIQSEGASANSDWYEQLINKSGWVVEMGGKAISDHVVMNRISDHQDRWLGALNWYGQAISDKLPASKIVKYAAALERLTMTGETGERKITDVVTNRTAVLSVDSYEPAKLNNALEKARMIYRWRSNLMHGRSSPFVKELVSVAEMAEQCVRQALLASLALYTELEMTGKNTSKDLENHFLELESILRKMNPKEKDIETRQ